MRIWLGNKVNRILSTNFIISGLKKEENMAKMDTIEAMMKNLDDLESSSDSELRRSSQASKKRSYEEIPSKNNVIQSPKNDTMRPANQYVIRKSKGQHGTHQPRYVSVEKARLYNIC